MGPRISGPEIELKGEKDKDSDSDSESDDEKHGWNDLVYQAGNAKKENQVKVLKYLVMWMAMLILKAQMWISQDLV